MTKLMEIELVLTDIIAGKLKGIAHIINDSLDNYEFNIVTDDNSTNEANDDGIL